MQLHSHNHIYQELVVQNLRRELHSSVTVRRFRKQKSCHHVIAIPQAGIAAPTLTGMQGFEAKKDSSVYFLRRSCKPRLYSVFFHSTHVLRDSSLTAIQTHARLLRDACPYHSITLAATISCKIAVFKPNVWEKSNRGIRVIAVGCVYVSPGSFYCVCGVEASRVCGVEASRQNVHNQQQSHVFLFCFFLIHLV